MRVIGRSRNSKDSLWKWLPIDGGYLPAKRGNRNMKHQGFSRLYIGKKTPAER